MTIETNRKTIKANRLIELDNGRFGDHSLIRYNYTFLRLNPGKKKQWVRIQHHEQIWILSPDKEKMPRPVPQHGSTGLMVSLR